MEFVPFTYLFIVVALKKSGVLISFHLTTGTVEDAKKRI